MNMDCPEGFGDSFVMETIRIKSEIAAGLVGFDEHEEFIQTELALLAMEPDWPADECQALREERQRHKPTSDQRNAAWAHWYLSRSNEWQALMDAQRCLAGQSEAVLQARRGSHKEWYTQPLIDMCNIARQRRPKSTAKHIYHALPDITPIAPIRSISVNKFGSLTIEATGRWGDVNYEFTTFESRLSAWTKAGLIKRKKLL